MYVGAISSFSCTTFSSCIQEIYSWSFYIVGFAAFAMILFAGVVWFTSAGNASKISQARSYISNAILGLIILFSSYLILNTINPDLVKGTINFPLWGQSTTKITYPTSVPDYCPGLAEASPIPTKDGTLLSSSLKQKLLIVFNDKSHPLWWITEAIPETVSHQDPGHQKGYAVDIAFKTPTDATTGNIASMKASLEAQGLTVLDEYTNPSAGSTGGHLHVTGDDCTVSMAPPSPDCGNGILEPGKGESCDGNDLGNFTCQSIGMAGAPKCTNFCAFDFNACTGSGETGFRITTEYLVDIKSGETYSTSILATGGEAPYRWSIVEGRLPSGFSLNSSNTKTAYISGSGGAGSSGGGANLPIPKVWFESINQGSSNTEGTESHPFKPGGMQVLVGTDPSGLKIAWGVVDWDYSDFCGDGAPQFFGAEDNDASLTFPIPKAKTSVTVKVIANNDGRDGAWGKATATREIWIDPAGATCSN